MQVKSSLDNVMTCPIWQDYPGLSTTCPIWQEYPELATTCPIWQEYPGLATTCPIWQEYPGLATTCPIWQRVPWTRHDLPNQTRVPWTRHDLHYLTKSTPDSPRLALSDKEYPGLATTCPIWQECTMLETARAKREKKHLPPPFLNSSPYRPRLSVASLLWPQGLHREEYVCQVPVQ